MDWDLGAREGGPGVPNRKWMDLVFGTEIDVGMNRFIVSFKALLVRIILFVVNFMLFFFFLGT